MELRLTPQYWDDYERLSRAEKQDVKGAIPTVSQAIQGVDEYYKLHRLQKMHGHQYIWEGHIKHNLCFTFNYGTSDDGEKICWIRRVGNHSIYENP